MSPSLGFQKLIELFDCEPSTLERVPWIERTMLDAANRADATIVSHSFHQFLPWGVSGVVVIAESHMTIHTWPEHGYAAVDFFFCDPEMDTDAAIDVLRARLRPGRIDITDVRRGRNLELQPQRREAG